ncbi:peptidylprolyl isomerase [Ramlibacter tataouinensis]|uniref:peptidylprolyl isomerase n=1 Tax=Ramlibacter tataouinensis TaxID=94132 RepID=UPI0022F3B638|nr:peptidylprolyl isomerase [Ramlibacter tataouinensis]WBY00077.1 peptidylprolyl isomerase [Ramlibacter tataouinensis]
MTSRALVLVLVSAVALSLPAAAQLRVSPQIGSGTPRAPAGPRPADHIVAVVNSEPITNNEVRTRLLRFEQQLAQQGAAMPPRNELAKLVLERLISEKAQLQFARESGLRISDAMVDQAEQNFARQNGMDVAQLHRRLAAEGLDPAAFREDLRNQLLLTRLREREVDQRVKVSEQDIDQFLREQAGGAGPVELNLGHILVALPENAGEPQVREAQAKAQRAHERARSGEDFGKLARELSDAPDAAAGGQMGLRSAERYPTLFVEAVQSLPQGGVSAVLRSGAGFHVLKVLERRKGGLPGAAVTQNHARHILLRPGSQLSEAQARDKLADFKRRIQSGQADFAQLAREHSQDASAQRGGDLGWSSPGMFVPEFEETIDGLAPGQIAEPLVSRFGVHLVQLLERREARLTEREQREMVRNVVREKKLDEAYEQWAQEVRGRAWVDLREPPT